MLRALRMLRVSRRAPSRHDLTDLTLATLRSPHAPADLTLAPLHSPRAQASSPRSRSWAGPWLIRVSSR